MNNVEVYNIIESIYRKKYDMFMSQVYRRCQDIDVCKIVVSDAFYAVLLYADKIESVSHAEAILTMAVKTRYYTYLRTESRKERKILSQWNDLLANNGLAIPSPEIIDYYPYINTIYSLVEELPEYHRNVIKWYYYEDRGIAEIAEVLKVSIRQAEGFKRVGLNYLKNSAKLEARRIADELSNKIDECVKLYKEGHKPKEIAKICEIDSRILRNRLHDRLGRVGTKN